MTDRHTPIQRSKNMASVKSKNTKPEIEVRKFLYRKGFRYRLNDKKLPGKPDIVLKKYKTVIFINGCFWHGHTCKKGKLPESNVDFWQEKIDSNKRRDLDNIEKLKELGWNVIIIWECELKVEKLEYNFSDIINQLQL